MMQPDHGENTEAAAEERAEASAGAVRIRVENIGDTPVKLIRRRQKDETVSFTQVMPHKKEEEKEAAEKRPLHTMRNGVSSVS